MSNPYPKARAWAPSDLKGLTSMDSAATTVYITLGSHLDLFWMGTHEECLARGTELARMALDLMERHPDYCYYIETTVFADYHLRKYPEDRERMERLIREGRLEIGGCYVDRVEHIHTGESLIRHAVLGVRWVRDTFGVPPRTAAHPDLPGMSPQIPQIYAKAGIRAYLRARGFGFAFDWVAPDGSRMLYANLWGYGRKGIEEFEAPLRAGDRPPCFFIRGGYSDLEAPDDRVLGLAETLRERHPEARFEFASPGRIVDRFDLDSLPSVSGEMPFGWGSIPAAFVRVMHLSVELEQMLLAAERWIAIALHRSLAVEPAPADAPPRAVRRWWGNGRSRGTVIYGDPIPPGQELRELWRYELFTQDHNYAGRHGAQSDFDKIVMKEHALTETSRWLDGALGAIASQIPAAGPDSVVVFNPLSWPREETLFMEHPSPECAALVEASGTRVPAQPTSGGLAARVHAPGVGYHVYTWAREERQPGRAADPRRLEDDHLAIEMDTENGCIARCLDRARGTDLLDAGGPYRLGEIVSYEDPGVDVRYGFSGRSMSDRGGRFAVAGCERGDVFSRVTLAGMFLDSRVEKEFTLDAARARLDLTIRIFWWGKKGEHLRVCFPFRREGFSETWYGVPFAAMRWPDMLHGTADEEILRQGGAITDMLGAEDRRHFREALGWLDVGYGDHGIAVGTRSTTFWIDGSLLQGVLLRTQYSCGDHNLWSLNPGCHEWRFRIEPHAGDWRQARAYRTGEEILMPMAAFPAAPAALIGAAASAGATGAVASPENGALPAEHEFLSIEPENVTLTAMKPSDDGEGDLIVRILECEGRPTQARIRMAGCISGARDVDLLEEDGPDLPVEDGMIAVKLKPYEFRTIRIRG